jgi:hypothetical protein
MFSRVLPLVVALAALAKAQPGSPDFFNSVANLYSTTSCSNSSLIYPNPIWGTGGYCQLLDPNNDIPPIIAYEVYAEDTGCNGEFYISLETTSRTVASRRRYIPS